MASGGCIAHNAAFCRPQRAHSRASTENTLFEISTQAFHQAGRAILFRAPVSDMVHLLRVNQYEICINRRFRSDYQAHPDC
jgi:hypothetical protein